MKATLHLLFRDIHQAVKLFRVIRRSKTTAEEFAGIVGEYCNTEPTAYTAKFYIDCTLKAKRTDVNFTKDECSVRFNFRDWR